jgi:hypothetical protein
MTWLEEQRAIRDLLLAPSPDEAVLQRLGGNPRRWLVYRRMVRARFAEVLEDGLWRFREAVGADAFSRLVERFLDGSPPSSPYLRDVPGEFLQFLRTTEALAPSALDVARLECAELELAHAPDLAGNDDMQPLDMHLHAVFSPLARLLEPSHDVAAGANAEPRPRPICVYRDAKTHEVQSFELTPLATRILRGIAQREAPLVDVAKRAAGEAGITVDSAFVETLSTMLADWVERGIVLGSRASG